MVLNDATTLFMLLDDEDLTHPPEATELIVVPQGTWHRFETPNRTQVMSVTPQPTDHSADRPAP